ncbi:hypothetical protein BDR05DRAFT_949747 [Suillus weaverae]|nr:hypothetical protein BDR05DRAFT_949747 [Suillus weaverae]
MSPDSIKHCVSLNLMPVKPGKRIQSHSPTSASSTQNISCKLLVTYSLLTKKGHSKSDDDIFYSSKYSPPPATFRRLSKKLEVLEYYTNEWRTGEMNNESSTVNLQTTIMDGMEKEIKRLAADNNCLRMENLEVFKDHLHEDSDTPEPDMTSKSIGGLQRPSS